MLLKPELRTALADAQSVVADLDAAAALLAFAREASDEEYDPELDADPLDSADDTNADDDLNNLGAIAYAMRAGMSVTAWGAAKISPNGAALALRARREFEATAAALYGAYLAGQIDLATLVAQIKAAYRQQAQNAWVAGKRSLGDLAALTQTDSEALDDLVGDDADGEGDWARRAAEGGLLTTIMTATNDVQNVQMVQQAFEKLAGHVAAVGAGIAALSNAGQVDALEQIGDGTIVYWELGSADHCDDCITLAEQSPYWLTVLNEAGIFPGSGHTQCGHNCACSLLYDIPAEVCGDSLVGGSGVEEDDINSDVASIGESTVEAGSGPERLNVWVQEAASCDVPIDVAALNSGADYSAIDDEDAFEWDEDIEASLTGEVTSQSQLYGDLVAKAEHSEEIAKLIDQLAWALEDMGGDIAKVEVGTLSNGVSTYRAVWHETAGKVHFKLGITTEGPTTLDPEFTLKALRQLSDYAAAEGKDLVIDGGTAGPGLQKWLDTLGATKTDAHSIAPTVKPAFLTHYEMPKLHILAPGEVAPPVPVAKLPAEVAAASQHMTDTWREAEQARLAAAKGKTPELAKAAADASLAKAKADLDLRALMDAQGITRLPRPTDPEAAIVYDRFERIEQALQKRGWTSGWTGQVSVVPKYSIDATVTRNGNLVVSNVQVLRDAAGKLVIKTYDELPETESLELLLHEAMHATSRPFLYRAEGTWTSGLKAMDEGVAEGGSKALAASIRADLGLEAPTLGEYSVAYEKEVGLLEQMRTALGITPEDFYAALHEADDRFAYLDGLIDASTGAAHDAASAARNAWKAEYSWGTPKAALDAIEQAKALPTATENIPGSKPYLTPKYSGEPVKVTDATAALNPIEAQALEDYSGGDYFWSVSGYLRGTEAPDKDVLRIVDGLDTAMDKAPAIEGTLYRGLGYEMPFGKPLDQLAKGDTWVDAGFGSTSVSKQVASTYGGVILQIEPDGIRGLNIEKTLGWASPDINREVVLQRDVRYEVRGISKQMITAPVEVGGSGEAEEFTVIRVRARPAEEPPKVPKGPPVEASAADLKAGIKPGDDQMFSIAGNPVPINAPLAPWSGVAPDEPPLPATKATADEIKAAKDAADKVRHTPQGVAANVYSFAVSDTKADTEAATQAGLWVEKVGNVRVIAKDEAALSPLKDYLAIAGHTTNDADFWHLLGYSDQELDTLDAAAAIGAGKRLTAGAVIVEPDGRMWLYTPKGHFGGYAQTWAKGGVDAGETAAQAAVREIREELGFSVELDAYLGDYENAQHTGIGRMFIAHRTGGGPLFGDTHETYKVKLVTPKEAKRMLVKYGKPEARDQQILADALKAINGESHAPDYVLPHGELGDLKAKITPPKLAGTIPATAPKTVDQTLTALNPVTVDPPTAAKAFPHDAAFVKSMMGSEVDYPAQPTFPFAHTVWTLADGSKQDCYWRVEPATGGGYRLFWGNAKKQLPDPVARLNVHVAQLQKLAEQVAADPTIEALRVNDALLAQVPTLKEMLVTAGATHPTAATTELSRADTLKLLDALKGAPMPKETPLIPTAPLIPKGVTVGLHGYGVDDVASILASQTESEQVNALQVLTTLKVGGKDTYVTWEKSAGLIPELRLWAWPSDLPPAQGYHLVVGQLGKAGVWLEAHPEMKVLRVNTAVGMNPGAADLLAKLGATIEYDGQAVLDRETVIAFSHTLKAEVVDAGHFLDDAWVFDFPGESLDVRAANATEWADKYQIKPDYLPKIVPHAEIEYAEDQHIAAWNHTGGQARAFRESAPSGQQYITKIEGQVNATVGASMVQYWGEQFELHPEWKGLTINSAAFGTLSPATQKLLLDTEGAKMLGGDVVVSRDGLEGLRAKLATYAPTKPVPALPPGESFVNFYDLDPGMLDAAKPEIEFQAGANGVIDHGFVTTAQGSSWYAFSYSPDHKTVFITGLKHSEELGSTEKLTAEFALVDEADALLGVDFDRVAFLLADPFDYDVNQSLRAFGAEMKAGGLVIDRKGLDAWHHALGWEADAEANAAFAAMLAKTDEDVLAEEVKQDLLNQLRAQTTHAAQSIVTDAATGQSIADVVASAVDAKGEAGTGGVKYVASTYGEHGTVIWRRLGNNLEMYGTAISPKAGGFFYESEFTTKGFAAHIWRMADAMEASPKIEALKLIDADTQLGQSLVDLVHSVGGKDYAGGIKLTRTQTLALRDALKAEVETATALPGPAAVELILAPKYGLPTGPVVSELDLIVTPMKQGFSKAAYMDPITMKEAAVVTRWLSGGVVWSRMTGAPLNDLRTMAGMREIVRIADAMEHAPAYQWLRVEQSVKLPAGLAKMLEDAAYTVVYDAQGMPVHIIERQKVLDLAAQLKIEMGVTSPVAAGTSHAAATLESQLGVDALSVKQAALGSSTWQWYGDEVMAGTEIEIAGSYAPFGQKGVDVLGAIAHYGTDHSLLIQPLALSTIPELTEALVKAGGSVLDGGAIVLGNETSKKVAEALKAGLAIPDATAAGKAASTAGVKLSAQLGYDAGKLATVSWSQSGGLHEAFGTGLSAFSAKYISVSAKEVGNTLDGLLVVAMDPIGIAASPEASKVFGLAMLGQVDKEMTAKGLDSLLLSKDLFNALPVEVQDFIAAHGAEWTKMSTDAAPVLKVPSRSVHYLADKIEKNAAVDAKPILGSAAALPKLPTIPSIDSLIDIDVDNAANLLAKSPTTTGLIGEPMRTTHWFADTVEAKYMHGDTGLLWTDLAVTDPGSMGETARIAALGQLGKFAQIAEKNTAIEALGISPTVLANVHLDGLTDLLKAYGAKDIGGGVLQMGREDLAKLGAAIKAEVSGNVAEDTEKLISKAIADTATKLGMSPDNLAATIKYATETPVSRTQMAQGFAKYDVGGKAGVFKTRESGSTIRITGQGNVGHEDWLALFRNFGETLDATPSIQTIDLSTAWLPTPTRNLLQSVLGPLADSPKLSRQQFLEFRDFIGLKKGAVVEQVTTGGATAAAKLSTQFGIPADALATHPIGAVSGQGKFYIHGFGGTALEAWATEPVPGIVEYATGDAGLVALMSPEDATVYHLSALAKVEEIVAEKDADSLLFGTETLETMPQKVIDFLTAHGLTSDGEGAWMISADDLAQAVADLKADVGMAPEAISPPPALGHAPTPAPVVPHPTAPAPPTVPEATIAQAPKITGLAAATGPVVSAPTTVTPAFVYGYSKGGVDRLGPTIVDTVTGTDSKGAVGHELTAGTSKATWSVSPSGKAVGWFKLDVAAGASVQETTNAAIAFLERIADEGAGRTTFFVKPEVYDKVAGLRQLLLDAGGKEADYTYLKTAIEMQAAQAKALAAALRTDTMTGLTLSVKDVAGYLLFDSAKATPLFSATPLLSSSGATWDVGGKNMVAKFAATKDGKGAVLKGITGDASLRSVTVAAQINWLAEQGIENLVVEQAALDAVPKLQQFLIAAGGTLQGETVRLDATALNNARKYLTHNVLPELLGGEPLGYSVVDEVGAKQASVALAAHSEKVISKGLAYETTFAPAEGREVTTTLSKSSTNLYWRTITPKAGATAGDTKAAAVAQLRSLLNGLAQDAAIERVDIDAAVLDQVPAIRAVMGKFGATEHLNADGSKYLSLDRARAVKMRANVEGDLAEALAPKATTAAGAAMADAMMVNWPAAEDLKATQAAASLGGQTKKVVFRDADGNDWLFKPGASGRGAIADQATFQLSAALGLPTPPVRVYTMRMPDGSLVSGSLQKMIPGVKELSLSTATDAQVQALLQNQVFDWLVANDDAHIANFLVDANGNVWGIDRSRAWDSLKVAGHDTLDRASNGNGITPAANQFWRDAIANPKLLGRIHPNTIATTLRALQNMPDEEFLRLVRPVAESATRNPNFKGQPEKFLAAMLDRKHSTASDFEAFYRRQITDALAGARKADVPAEWQAWLKAGGHFNLSATARDLMEEDLAALDARFGPWDPNKMERLLTQPHLSVLKSKLDNYYGGAKGHVNGQSVWEAEKIRGKAGIAQVEEEWRAIHRYYMLHVCYKGDQGPMPAADAIFRKYFDKDTGRLRLTRTTNRYADRLGRKDNPNAYIAGYNKDGIRNLVGTSVGRVTTVGGGGGVIYYIDADYSQVYTSFGLGMGAGGSLTHGTHISATGSLGEQEVMVNDLRPEQIILIRSHSDPLPFSSLMGYNGPVIDKTYGPA